MDGRIHRFASTATAVRLTLVAFVFAWLLGPSWLQSNVPLLLVFALALGLELHFFVGARRAAPPIRPDRGPQDVDRERYGYAGASDDLLVVREGGEELWLPYAGETEEEVLALVAEARAAAAEEQELDLELDLELEQELEQELESAPAGRLAPRSPVRGLLTGLGVIGALALVLWAAQARTGWNGLDADARAQAEALFSAEASRLAEKEVAIRCDAEGAHVGVVQHAEGAAVVGGDVAYLSPERCFDLYRLAFRGEVSDSQTGRALTVLAHEAWHLRGVRDEGTTECYALQSAVEIGRRLGLSEDTARRLMRQRLSENPLHARGSPEYLVPAECRAGGELDLDPDSDRFP